MLTHMVVLVLDDIDKLTDIFDAWQELGIAGITVTNSTGMHRLNRRFGRDDLPLMPSLKSLFEMEDDVMHRMVFAVLPENVDYEDVLDATEQVLGDLNRPRTGICFVVPVVAARGLDKPYTLDNSH